MSDKSKGLKEMITKGIISKKIFSKKTAFGMMLMSFLLITGCSQVNTTTPSSVATPKPTGTQQQLWQQRQAFLARKTTWTLNSKASLRFGEENHIFGLDWAQKPSNNYVVDVKNPITGAVVSKLSRTNSIVRLIDDSGRIFQDTDEDRLLLSQSNLRIPVKGLQHWVRGLTSPQSKVDQLVLDGAGRPRTLQQAGWTIKYSSYVNNGTNALPRKINLSRGAEEIFIRLIAKKWQ